MAEQYAFADEFFQTNEGPRYPAYQFLVRGTSKICIAPCTPMVGSTRTPLVQTYLSDGADMSHTHPGFLTDYKSGANNGLTAPQCAYVPPGEAYQYYNMAEQYAFADEFFQTNQGPSYPAHQYLVRGTSTICIATNTSPPPHTTSVGPNCNSDGSSLRASENTIFNGASRVGCDAVPGMTGFLIDSSGNETQSTHPCAVATSIFTRLDGSSLTWRYYQSGTGAFGFFHAVDALYPIRSSTTEYNANVVTTPAQILTDIGNGTLAKRHICDADERGVRSFRLGLRNVDVRFHRSDYERSVLR